MKAGSINWKREKIDICENLKLGKGSKQCNYNTSKIVKNKASKLKQSGWKLYWENQLDK